MTPAATATKSKKKSGTKSSTTTKTTKKKTTKKTTGSAKKRTKKGGGAVKKKAASKGATHVAAPPGADYLVHELHGVALRSGDPKKSKRGVVAQLTLNQLAVIPNFNPRATLGDVGDLAASIKKEGVLQNLVVRPAAKEGVFEVIAGERRHAALTKLGWKEPIPALIRTDLGDNDKALAVALAENSDDGRTNLNMLDIGRSVQKLQKAGWTLPRIARDSGLHLQRVRRALDLLDTPKEVQSLVASGDIAVQVGLEVAKVDPKFRSKVAKEIDSNTTAADVRGIRKKLEQEQEAEAAAQGVDTTKTKKGSVKTKLGVTTWKGSLEKQHMLQSLCSRLVSYDADMIGTTEFHEVRGGIGALLWDRGDRSSPLLPDLTPEKGPDYAAIMKELGVLTKVIEAEASKHDAHAST